MAANAEAFARAFVVSYQEARASVGVTQWDDIWNDTSKWNWFMLWGRSLPVVERTATRMSLEYYQRELFHFDGVLVRRDTSTVGVYRLPLAAVVEHENDIRGFEVEVAKLYYIRAPLKAGITYVLHPPPGGLDASAWRDRVLRWARGHWDLANREVLEGSQGEYCFLIGVQEAAPRELQWWVLSFDAGVGPVGAGWRIVDG